MLLVAMALGVVDHQPTTSAPSAPVETQGPATVDPYWSCVEAVTAALRKANPQIGDATSEAMAETACLNNHGVEQ
jgi:hypothetical protein